MAFLSYTDIVDILPDADQSQVERLLSFVEIELLSQNLDFTDPTATTRTFYSVYNGQHTVPVPFCHGITSVTLKNARSTSDTTLIDPANYHVANNALHGGTFQIILHDSVIGGQYYLAVNAIWSLPTVDWTSRAWTPLKNAIVDFITEQIKYQAQGSQVIRSSSTGDTSVTFAEIKRSEASLLMNERIQTILSLYV